MFGLSDTVIDEIRNIFESYSNIEEVLIFGSRAKGNYRTGSDIDLAAKGDAITFDQLMDINLKIENLGLLYKVDVLSYEEKKGTPIGDHIDRVAKVFYKKTSANHNNLDNNK